MKTTILFCLLGTTLAAPTKTIEDRQLGNLGSGSGLGALSSLLPGIGNLGSGVGGSSGSGLSLPNIPGLGNLGSGLGGSSGGGLSLPSFSNTPSLGNLGGLNGNAKRQMIGGGSSTANGVTDNESCQPLTFIFARGTGEMGNMGSVVGPPVASQLKTLTGDKVVVQGVDYPASAAGNAGMGASGGPDMAKLVKQALSQCPKTTVVLGGYSQGAMVVHNAANQLGANQIAGAVLFGDPLKTQPVGKLDSSKVKEYCALGDPVCANGANAMAHLSYGNDAKEAAQFLVKAAGV